MNRVRSSVVLRRVNSSLTLASFETAAFGALLRFDDAILEQRLSVRDRAIRWKTLDLNRLIAEINLLIDRRFDDDIAAYTHPAVADIALAEAVLHKLE
jgi:hypothetical protein